MILVIFLLLLTLISLLIYLTKHHIENFFLSKKLVDKYMKQKHKEISKKYNEIAWNHCKKLMRLQLKWAPDEREVSTIEEKEFPCGNTVEKCLKKTMKLLKEGKPIPNITNQQIDDYLK